MALHHLPSLTFPALKVRRLLFAVSTWLSVTTRNSMTRRVSQRVLLFVGLIWTGCRAPSVQ
jgi:hypothetical protein